MNEAITKKLELWLAWEDRGFNRGLNRAQRGIDALKKRIMSVVKAAALIAGALVGATAALVKFIAKGSEAKSVEESFLGFARSAGLSADTLDRLRESVRRTVDDTTLMQASVQALSGGLDPGRLVQYWEMAKQIADVSTKDTVEVFQALTLAINKAEPRTLEQIGITIRMGEAIDEYVRKTGKQKSALTSLDRTMAISSAIQGKYIKDFYSVGDVTTRVREKYQQLQTSVENLKSRFFELVAGSPKVEGFLVMLREKVEEVLAEMTAEDVDKFVGKFIGLLEDLSSVLDRLEGYGQKVKNFWDTWEAPLKGLGGGLLVGKITAGIASIAAAAGLITGPVGGIIALTVGAVAGLGITAVEAFKNMREGAEEARPPLSRLMDTLDRKPQNLSEFSAMMDDLLGKAEEVKKTGEEKRTPGGLTPREVAWDQDIKARGLAGVEDRDDIEAFLDKWRERVAAAQDHTATLIDLEEYRARRAMEIGSLERQRVIENNRMMRDSFRRGYSAMGDYQREFYKHGAHMGRALNAMLIRGFTETAASYIEMKTEQARIDAAWFAAHAIGALASGDFGRAAAYGSAAARLGALAGAAMIAAGAVRAYGTEKAESMMEDGQRQDEAAFSETEGDAPGTRRKAAGVVNGRPITINILSRVDIKSGVTVFGGSEDGLEEFYGEHIRDYIQEDIETGIISIPA